VIKDHETISSTEQGYTAQEVAAMFAISPTTLRQYTSKGKIHASLPYDAGLRFSEADITAFRDARAGMNGNIREKKQNTSAAPQTLPHLQETVPLPAPSLVSPPEGVNEALLLQEVIAHVFTFLSDHQLQASIQALREIPATVRMWEITVADGQVVQVIAERGQVTVLAHAYLHALEEANAQMNSRVHDAEMTLAFLRKKRENRVLHEYAEALSVQIEPCAEGVLVTCSTFPIAAREKSEEEALAAFRRLLWGYTAWLRNHLATLSPALRVQFEQLKALLLENGET